MNRISSTRRWGGAGLATAMAAVGLTTLATVGLAPGAKAAASDAQQFPTAMASLANITYGSTGVTAAYTHSTLAGTCTPVVTPYNNTNFPRTGSHSILTFTEPDPPGLSDPNPAVFVEESTGTGCSETGTLT